MGGGNPVKKIISSSKDKKSAKNVQDTVIAPQPKAQITDTQNTMQDVKPDKTRASIFQTEGGSGGMYGEKVSKRKTLFGN